MYGMRYGQKCSVLRENAVLKAWLEEQGIDPDKVWSVETLESKDGLHVWLSLPFMAGVAYKVFPELNHEILPPAGAAADVVYDERKLILKGLEPVPECFKLEERYRPVVD